jgi:hypothetical protein
VEGVVIPIGVIDAIAGRYMHGVNPIGSI